MMILWDVLAISGGVAWVYVAWHGWQRVRGLSRRIRWALSGWRQPVRRYPGLR